MSEYTLIRRKVFNASEELWMAVNQLQDAWNQAANCGMLTSSRDLFVALQDVRSMADKLDAMCEHFIELEENDDDA